MRCYHQTISCGNNLWKTFCSTFIICSTQLVGRYCSCQSCKKSFLLLLRQNTFHVVIIYFIYSSNSLTHLILEDEGSIDGLLVLEKVVGGLHEEVVRRLHPDVRQPERARSLPPLDPTAPSQVYYGRELASFQLESGSF